MILVISAAVAFFASGHAFASGYLGAINVLMQVSQREDADEVLDNLQLLGFAGSDIWVGYKDFAGQDVNTFVRAVLSNYP